MQGLLRAWLTQGDQTSAQVEACAHDLASEVSDGYTHHILLVKQIAQASQHSNEGKQTLPVGGQMASAYSGGRK